MNERDLLKATIANHLFFNHYPHLPKSLVSACVDAIDFMNSGEDDSLIPLPNGMEVNGKTELAAFEIVEFCHLENFLNSEGEE